MGCWNLKWFKMLCHPSRWNKCPTCVGVDAGWENSLMDDEWQRLAGSCEFTKPLNSWTVVQLLDDFSAHICGRPGARSSFWTGKLVWNVRRVEPGCCVMCSGRLFAWLGPWNHADFPRSPFNQRCFFRHLTWGLFRDPRLHRILSVCAHLSRNVPPFLSAI